MRDYKAFDDPPMVWALLARRPGDNAQIETLARALDLPVAVKRLGLRKGLEALPNLRRGGSLFSYDRETQDRLVGEPGPDLVIAAGKRSAPAALWLKARRGARLVHLGRTWAPGAWFDAVITTPQYAQRRGLNVVENLFPLTPATDAAAAPAPDLAALPRPRLMVVAGGDAAGLSFDAETARALGRLVCARQAASGGSLLVATSPRTPPASARALADAIAPRNDRVVSLFGFGTNRYRDFLAAADALIVTEDSVSMVADAASTGRPVEIFRLKRRAPSRVSRLIAGSKLGALGLVDSGREISAYMDALETGGWLDGRGRARLGEELSAATKLARRLALEGPRLPVEKASPSVSRP